MDADARLHGPDATAAGGDAAVAEYLPQLDQSASTGDSDAAKSAGVLRTISAMSIDQKRDLEKFFGSLGNDPNGDAKAGVRWVERLRTDAGSGSATAAQSQKELDDFGAFLAGAAAAPAPGPAPPAAPVGQAAPAAPGSFEWPVHAPVTQEFGGDGGHPGIDLAAAAGTPIKAATSGTVIIAGDGGSAEQGYGNVVVIQSDDGSTFTRYAHQSEVHVQVGQHVDTGQEIGLVGSTGDSTGPHLHFEVRTGDPYGQKHNPRDYAAGDP